MCKSSRGLLIAAAALLMCGTASASPDFGTLVFTQPAGFVGPTDAIPVQITFTASSSYTLVTDAGGRVTQGAPSLAVILANLYSNLPAAVDPHNDKLDIVINNPYQCGGTFGACLTGPPYDFDFFPGYQFGNLNILPGGSFTYTHGSFLPTGGSAPQGTYEWSGSIFGIQINDLDVLDANGYSTPIAFINLATTMESNSTFSRTVVGTAIPEPGSLWLAGLGVAAVALRARRS